FWQWSFRWFSAPFCLFFNAPEEREMRRNVWIAGLTILFAAGTLTMAPAFAFAAETLPQGIYAGELDLAGVPAEEAKETVSQYVEEKLNQEVVLVIDGNEAKAGA